MNATTIRFLDFYTYLLKEKKIKNKSSFAKNLNVSSSSLTEIVNKRTNVGIKLLQNTVSYYHELNPTWLLTGKGEMLKTARQEAVISAPVCSQSCRYISDLRYTIEVQKKLIGILSNANKSV